MANLLRSGERLEYRRAQDELAGLQRQAVPAPAPATPAPADAGASGVDAARLEVLLETLPHAFQDLMELQIVGLDSLKTDLETRDQPSLSESVLAEAVSLAVIGATGAIGGLVATSVLNKASAMIKAASAASTVGTAATRAAALAVDLDLARGASDGVKDAVKAGLRDAVGAVASGMKGKPAVEQFISTSRISLVRTKAAARNEFIARKASFRADRFGLQQAEALLEAIKETERRAPDEQYLKSLSAWAGVQAGGGAGMSELFGGERPGTFVVELDIPRPTAPVRIKSAVWPGVNDRTRKTLQDNYQERTVWEINPPRVVLSVVIRPWKAFSGSETIRLEKGAGGDNVQFLSSGTPLYWLAARAAGRDEMFGGEQPTYPNALAAAHILWGEVMGMRIKQFGSIGD